MTTLYLCGAITGSTDWNTRFTAAEAALRAAGYDVVNPANHACATCGGSEVVQDRIGTGEPIEDQYSDCPDCPSHEEYVAMGIAALAKCDGCAVIAPGWERSAGALAEIRECDRLGMPVHVVGMWLRYAQWEREEST